MLCSSFAFRASLTTTTTTTTATATLLPRRRDAAASSLLASTARRRASSASGGGEPRSLRVVVFGGNGFVGTSVCRAALARSHDVVCVSRSGAPSAAQARAADPSRSANWLSLLRAQRDVDVVAAAHGRCARSAAACEQLVDAADAVVSCIGAFGSHAAMEAINGDANVYLARLAAGVRGNGARCNSAATTAVDDDGNVPFETAAEAARRVEQQREQHQLQRQQQQHHQQHQRRRRFVFVSSHDYPLLLPTLLRGYANGKRRTELEALRLFGADGCALLKPGGIAGVRVVAGVRVRVDLLLAPLGALPRDAWRGGALASTLLVPPVSVDDVARTAIDGAEGRVSGRLDIGDIRGW